MELINKQTLYENMSYAMCRTGFQAEACAVVKSARVIEAAPVVHGKWIIKRRHHGGIHLKTGTDALGVEHTISVDERYESDDYICSECKKRFEEVALNYCPNCGAKMDLEDVSNGVE